MSFLSSITKEISGNHFHFGTSYSEQLKYMFLGHNLSNLTQNKFSLFPLKWKLYFASITLDKATNTILLNVNFILVINPNTKG